MSDEEPVNLVGDYASFAANLGFIVGGRGWGKVSSAIDAAAMELVALVPTNADAVFAEVKRREELFAEERKTRPGPGARYPRLAALTSVLHDVRQGWLN